jgi:hypothetical protein
MPSMFEKSVSAWRHLAVWLIWQATGTSLIEDGLRRNRPGGERPAARCPRTGLGVPECSCPHCISEQVRQHRPELFSGSRLV